jgi:hypothetical protein
MITKTTITFRYFFLFYFILVISDSIQYRFISKWKYDFSDIKRYLIEAGITKIKQKGDVCIGNPNIFEKEMRSLIQWR